MSELFNVGHLNSFIISIISSILTPLAGTIIISSYAKMVSRNRNIEKNKTNENKLSTSFALFIIVLIIYGLLIAKDSNTNKKKSKKLEYLKHFAPRWLPEELLGDLIEQSNRMYLGGKPLIVIICNFTKEVLVIIFWQVITKLRLILIKESETKKEIEK